MKKILVGLMVLLAATFFASCNNDSGSDVPKTYEVGDKGPAGGIIFLVKDEVQTSTYTDGSGSTKKLEWKYLEAAPSDCTGGYYWGPSSPSYGTGTENGDGWSNAKRIEASGIANFPAFSACASYGKGTKYKDWFLPSKEELNLMFNELYTKNLGSFEKDGYYWSSSEYSESKAWIQRFEEEGRQGNATKNVSYYRVRPIRAFK